MPAERRLILAFLERAVATLPAGARVLDAGAGDAPYRELFATFDYRTTDWAGSLHAGARRADVLAPLDDLPLPDGSFDAVVCTQVLEHLPDPASALAELRRVLVGGGTLWLTAPLVGPLHEEPHDYFRYTSHGLRTLTQRAGFAEVQTEPLGGYFTSLAVLLHAGGAATGVATGVRQLPFRVLALAARCAARCLPALDRLDRRRDLPVGFACTAVAPSA